MMRYQVRVAITLKPEILDPAGQAVHESLGRLGFLGVQSARIGRLVDLTIEAEDEADAVFRAEEAARRLLANPVMERFAVWVDHA